MDHLTRSQCQHCLDLIVGQESEFSSRFFPLLFQRAPKLRLLFPTNIDNARIREKVLYSMMREFTSDGRFQTAFQIVGIRTARHGMGQNEQMILIDTWIGTLKRQLGNSWQPDFTYAWRIAKEDARTAMQRGASRLAA